MDQVETIVLSKLDNESKLENPTEEHRIAQVKDFRQDQMLIGQFSDDMYTYYTNQRLSLETIE
jgi:hypothetical protein